VHNSSVDQRKSYISDCLILEWPLWFGSSSLQFLDSTNGSSWGLILGSFQKQCNSDTQIISGTDIRKTKWELVQLTVWLPLPQTKCLLIPSTAWTKTCWHSVRSGKCPSWNLTYHSCACVIWCECIWHALNRGSASSGRAVLGRYGTRLPLSWERIYCAWWRPNHS